MASFLSFTWNNLCILCCCHHQRPLFTVKSDQTCCEEPETKDQPSITRGLKDVLQHNLKHWWGPVLCADMGSASLQKQTYAFICQYLIQSLHTFFLIISFDMKKEHLKQQCRSFQVIVILQNLFQSSAIWSPDGTFWIQSFVIAWRQRKVCY